MRFELLKLTHSKRFPILFSLFQRPSVTFNLTNGILNLCSGAILFSMYENALRLPWKPTIKYFLYK